jgi:hypothetical protein
MKSAPSIWILLSFIKSACPPTIIFPVNNLFSFSFSKIFLKFDMFDGNVTDKKKRGL